MKGIHPLIIPGAIIIGIIALLAWHEQRIWDECRATPHSFEYCFSTIMVR